jgi:hypothetical protein
MAACKYHTANLRLFSRPAKPQGHFFAKPAEEQLLRRLPRKKDLPRRLKRAGEGG